MAIPQLTQHIERCFSLSVQQSGRGKLSMNANEQAEHDRGIILAVLKGPKNPLTTKKSKGKRCQVEVSEEDQKRKKPVKKAKSMNKSMEKAVFKNKNGRDTRQKMHVVL